ncbi:MAG: ArsR family transcriptional regulator [bacterium]|nr:ArsR family transcriptional regulator [bacterium]
MDADLTVLKACADATRLRILYILCERELCVCELVAVLDMAQACALPHDGRLCRPHPVFCNQSSSSRSLNSSPRCSRSAFSVDQRMFFITFWAVM